MASQLSDENRAKIAEALDEFRNREVMASKRMPSITFSEIYRAMGYSDGPVTHINEIADYLDVGTGAIRHRLHKMEEHGVIKRKKMGERTEVWYFESSNNTDPFHQVNFTKFRKFLDEEVLS